MMLIQNGQVNPVLTALMEAMGLHVEDGSPSGVNAVLQQEWVKAKDGVIRAKLGGRSPNDLELGLLEEIGGREIPIDPSSWLRRVHRPWCHTDGRPPSFVVCGFREVSSRGTLFAGRLCSADLPSW